MPSFDPDQQHAFAVEVVDKLRSQGFEAYWAGGCVRDLILGRPPKDYDVATSARPEEIRALFGSRRTIAIGAAFGVITVLGPKQAGQVEVATFREDAAYSDGRRPDAVAFSTAAADAERRDFTINGLFFDPLENRVVDYVGGQEDLKRGIVRAIGDPRARLAEDKLRLLRAVRFTASFDFALDAPTRAAVEEMAPQINVVSVERIAAEVRLMLEHPRRAAAVRLLHKVGLLDVILPELSPAEESPTSWTTALAVLEALGAESSFPLALAALLGLFVNGKGCQEICRRWKLSNRDTQETGWLITNQQALADARHARWPKLQRILIADHIDDLLRLVEATAQAEGKPSDDVAYCRELLKLPPQELNPPPLITGDDLIAHGVPRGKEYQRLLEAVRDAQLEKKITTKVEALALVDRLRAGPDKDATG